MLHTSSFAFRRADINLDGPTIPAPPGYVSILDNPPNGNHIAIPIITLCVVLSAFSFLLRFYAKFLAKKFNVADYLTAVIFPLFWVYIYYSYRLTWTSGYLVHEWDIPLKDITAFSYVCWIASLLYFWLIALVKCAILLEWKDIFAPTTNKRNYTSWLWYGSAVAISSLSTILFIMDLVNCTPFEANWNALIPGATCRFQIPGFAVASATTNLALELIPLALAQKAIWGLHMSWRKKLGVSGVFFIGIIGCVADAVRLYYSTRFFISTDTSYYFSIMALCSLCETTCASLILCVPFAPKALGGITQTRAYAELKNYMTLRTTLASTNNNTTGYRKTEEVPYGSKPKEIWVTMDTRVSRDGTANSVASNHPLNA